MILLSAAGQLPAVDYTELASIDPLTDDCWDIRTVASYNRTRLACKQFGILLETNVEKTIVGLERKAFDELSADGWRVVIHNE